VVLREDWGRCLTDCGNGFQNRNSYCNHPIAKYGGKSCDFMKRTQQKECTIANCDDRGNCFFFIRGTFFLIFYCCRNCKVVGLDTTIIL
jgi:hypothetical protein